MMSLTPTPSACMRPGSSSMLICALDAAGDRGAADVAHGLQALDDDLVGQRREIAHERMSERTAIDTIGWSSGLKRWISGSLTSGLKAARTCWTFSRTSWWPPPEHGQLELGDDDRAAFERARGQGLEAGDGVDRFLDLAADLASRPSPARRRDSRCCTTTMESRRRGTGRRRAAGRRTGPSTSSATIIMVAKTGLLILMRVIHMAMR